MEPAPAGPGVQDGLLLADKPPGKTSHDVVAGVRRSLPRGVKVGHAGTLDPFATGLLLVLIGRATRCQRFFMALPKTYVALARFGAVSTTGDPEGEITETGVLPDADPELPVGEVRQRPPAHSAVKIGGERAYRLARRGEAPDMPERTVTVHRFEQLRRDGARAEYEIECSSGTYVRSLIAGLGDAYCEELRRTAIGPFRVEDSGREVPLGEALGLVMPSVELAGEEAVAAAHGRAVPAAGDPGAPYVLLRDAGGAIAVAEPRPDGGLKPVVGLRG